MTGTKRCDSCWETEYRLEDYVKSQNGRRHIYKLIGANLSINNPPFNVQDDPDIRLQKDKILYRLKDHNWHTKKDLENCSGSERVASRIHDLKNEGKEILRQWHPDKKRVYMYRLKS